tara:strand:+ start:24998 stop:25426 length:429 start_codon:yes stop_codon:yes gene_type:complete
MKTKLILVITFLVSLTFYSQTIAIPDSNFEQALIDLGWDTNGLDGFILQADAQAIDSLKIGNPVTNDLIPNVAAKIQSIVGVAAMTNLIYLNLRDNEISEVDLSANTNLEYVDFSRNQFTTIDLSQNAQLISLQISDNALTL